MSLSVPQLTSERDGKHKSMFGANLSGISILGSAVSIKTNGLLFVVPGIQLLKLPHYVGGKAVRVMVWPG
jgi:hypothetical protein